MNRRERDVIASSELGMPHAATIYVDAVRRVEVRDDPDAVLASDLCVLARNRLIPEPIVTISGAPEDECDVGSVGKVQLDRRHLFFGSLGGGCQSEPLPEAQDCPERTVGEIEDEATEFVPRPCAVGEIDPLGKRLEREVPLAPAPAQRLRDALPLSIRYAKRPRHLSEYRRSGATRTTAMTTRTRTSATRETTPRAISPSSSGRCSRSRPWAASPRRTPTRALRARAAT